MSTDTLIRRAMDAGVCLAVVDGQLRVTGKRRVMRAWLPQLRDHKAALMQALAAPETVDWRPLATAYNLHHTNCTSCIAAGRGYGLRCGTGAALWAAYRATEGITESNQ